MTEPAQWGKAHMNWSPEGYVLRVPLWVDERPLHESRVELRAAVDDALREFEVVDFDISPMEVARSQTVADADPGELYIATCRMIDADAATQLRNSVSRILRDAITKGDQGEEVDKAAWQLVREALRQSAS